MLRMIPLLLVAITVMAGCVLQAPKGQSGSADSAATIANEAPRLARSFAGPMTYLDPLPTVTLLLSRHNEERNTEICRAYLGVQTVDAAREASVVDSNLIVTRMVLKTSQPNERQLGDCDYLLSIYDYDRAAKLLRQINLPDSAGPVLLTVFPQGPQEASNAVLIADASVEPPERLLGFFNEWEKALTVTTSRLMKAKPQIDPVTPTTPRTSEPPFCDGMSAVVQETGSLLVEVIKLVVGEFPFVKILVGFIEGREEVGKALKAQMSVETDRLIGRLADGTKIICSEALEAIRLGLGYPAQTGSP